MTDSQPLGQPGGAAPEPAGQPASRPAPDYGPQPFRPQPPRRTRKAYGQRTFRWILVVVLGIHAALAYTQSILAGAYLSGSLDAMAVHGAIGSALTAFTMLQGVACLLFWFPGRGPWWPLLATVLLFFVEGLQVGMGYARTLGLHIPLGVALIMVITAMFVWSLVWRPTARKDPA